MRKLLGISVVTLLTAALLALTPGLAMADTSDVSFEVEVHTYLEGATTIRLMQGTAQATVSSECITSGTMNATFGLIATETADGTGFHEADFSATLDGRSYSGAWRGIHIFVHYDLMEMWGKFHDNNHDRLEGRYHILLRITDPGPPPEYDVELLEMEITWKDGQQCYCELNVDSLIDDMEWTGDVAANSEYFYFTFDGDSTGHYAGTFDGYGDGEIFEGLGGEAWHGKGLVYLDYTTNPPGDGEVWAYAKMDAYDAGLPIVKELSLLGAALETTAVGLDGSVNLGNLYLNITDPETPVGTGSGSFRVRHTHSGPCPQAPPEEEGCFIATAACGPDDASVETLRSFRDSYMSTDPLGSALVSAYYNVSPPIAEFIDDHPALKPAVRAALLPAVGMSEVAVGTSRTEKVAIVTSMVLTSALTLILFRRRARRAGV